MYQKHGLSKHPLYTVWNNMKTRCYKEYHKEYKYWGGRGINICDEWKENFYCFYKWAMTNGYKQGLQVDRINNDGNYSPENCRFVSGRINSLNKRKQENSSSGYTGVGFCKHAQKWYSRIKIHGSNISLGYFSSRIKAVLARDFYIIENTLINEYGVQVSL